jgi:arylsulfatase A-like enzyme
VDKPNILVIWGDDIGVHNISAYNHGIMGYQTPNIDRIAKEGAMFTDSYAQQSCTAGGRRSSWAASVPHRSADHRHARSDHGMPDWAPTIADLLKEQGYTTGQFGKNHLGDRTSTCRPTTASTSFSATSTTSTPRKSRRPTTTRRIRSSARSSDRAA